MIVPNSEVYILKNVPLEPSFDHTIWFDSADQQATAFTTYALAFYFNKVSYQRYPRPYITLDKTADELFDCNYMMFRNTAYGTKWFYAFITQVEYISNTTSRIYYSIDPMQTYLFDVNVGQCFVEREHAMSDAIGDNLIPESFELGEYKYQEYALSNNIFAKTTYAIRVMTTCTAIQNDDGSWVISRYGGGTVRTGIYTGVNYHYFRYDPNNPQKCVNDCNSMLKAITEATGYGGEDAILSISIVPYAFCTSIDALVKDLADPPAGYDYVFDSWSGSFDGYTPKNNKLYTEPFCGVYVDNLQGNAARYAYEYFTDRKPHFEIIGTDNGNLEVVSIPHNYKGLPSCYAESLTLANFPQCSWNIDTYRAWLVQNRATIGAGILNSSLQFAGSLAAGLATAGAAGIAAGGIGATTQEALTWGSKIVPFPNQQNAARAAAIEQSSPGMAFPSTSGIVSTVINTVAAVKTAELQPNHAKGQSTNSIWAAIGKQGFHYYNYRIQGQFARIIDDFFSMFGYKTNRLKVPNRNGRKAWNYVKTCGCTLTGSAPADVTAALVQIYDRGITFWRCIDLSTGNPFNRVGNYSLDNSL